MMVTASSVVDIAKKEHASYETDKMTRITEQRDSLLNLFSLKSKNL